MGGEIEIPTLDGHARIKIPAETQTGKAFRLKGKGIKGVRSHATGDLICHVVVETPVNLSEKQREMLKEFDLLAAGRNNNPRAQSFMDKIKAFFAQ